MRTSNTPEFVEKARKVHGNKYDYSKVEYIHNKIKVCIICPIHGEFWQKPHDHLRPNGCPKCKGVLIRNSKLRTQEQFIVLAKEKHNNKYDYSKTVYVDGLTKVCIICPKHVEFFQTPQDHLSGRGCCKCAGYGFTTKDFIDKANEIHNYKYDYSKAVYIKGDEYVCIICPIHGEFWQRASIHLHGHGCSKCSWSKGELNISQFLTKHNIEFIPQYIINCPINVSGIAKVDFYLPTYNIFIEYNGKQHYEPIEYFGGRFTFEHQQLRDTYIKTYCKENNIEFIEISYKESKYIEFLKIKLNIK